MSSWSSYPKVWHLGHNAIPDLLHGTVLIQEKYDGSQFSFGVFDGELKTRSRGREFDPDAPDKQFSAAVAHVRSVENRLVEGHTYRGEVLASPRHNVLRYSRTPAGHIVLFDITSAHQQFVSPSDVMFEAARLDIEPAATLFDGPGSEVSMIFIERLLTRDSSLGGAKIEGVVIKNYAHLTRFNQVAMGKYVREEFKEKMRQAKPKSNKDVVTSFIEAYRTEARWRKAVQHLSERGELKGDPTDIGPLLKELSTDLLEEEGEAIKDMLFKRVWKEISRGVGRGFPEWYKQELASKQFQGENTHE